MTQHDDLQPGDVIALLEEIATNQDRVIPVGTEGVITRAFDTGQSTLYVVDFDQYGIRFMRRSAIAFVERPPDIRAEWDRNAHLQQMLRSPSRVFVPFSIRLNHNENDPDSAA